MTPRRVVMIVDDQIDEIEELAATLGLYGIEVIKATNAEDALSLFVLTMDLFVVLLDIKMPGIDGLKLLDEIRASGLRGETATLIMTTGSPDVHSVVDALNLGASALLLKPIDPKELIAAISKAFDTHKLT